MKRTILLLVALFTFSTSSFAQQLSPSELDFVFDRSDTLELAYLSDTEMQQTKGAWIWLAPAGGALLGGGGYWMGYYNNNYSWSTPKFIGNTMMGAATGSYFGWGARMASGIGSLIWRANGWILNSGLNRIWRR